MKRSIVALLIFILLLSATACKKSEDKRDIEEDNSISDNGFPYEITSENRIRTMGASYAPCVYELDENEQGYLMNAIVSSAWTMIKKEGMSHDGETYIIYIFDEAAPYKISFYSDGYADIECDGEVSIYLVQGDAYQVAGEFCTNTPGIDKLIECDIDNLTADDVWLYDNRLVRTMLSGDELLDYLASLPDESEELFNEGCFVITNQGSCYGQNYLEAFLEEYNNSVSTAITIGQYTLEGDLVLSYISYDGQQVTLTLDSRRDSFAGDGNLIYTRNSKYFSVMELPRTGGSIMFLHDDSNMTPEKVEEILASSSMEDAESYGFYWIGSFTLE